jgi:hypothetical protein
MYRNEEIHRSTMICEYILINFDETEYEDIFYLYIWMRANYCFNKTI